MNYTSNEIIEEPDAVIPHVRICMGAAQATGRSTMTAKEPALTNKIPCRECGKEVLPSTIEKTAGFCMPCSKERNMALSQIPGKK